MNTAKDTRKPPSFLSMDDRLNALDAWLRATLAGVDFRIEPASADASFRRYFRVFVGDGRTLVAMDAPPERENSEPFVRIAKMFRDAGLNAPEVLAQDLPRGFLLLTDLGTRSYLQALRAENFDALFGDATTALVKWQAATRPGSLPAYDEALLRRELSLFPEWYIGRHLGVQLGERQKEALETTFKRIVATNLAEGRVNVHRDYMPRNLMVCEPNPGILDFQDAVIGPISYDVASLFRDAFISWDEERVLDGTVRYWEKARRARLPVREDFGEFWRDVEWMGLQRHLKVLGIFARLHYRDGKKGYLEDTPRFIGYVRHAIGRYGELVALGRLLDELEGRTPQAGYTF
jgi:aminoglycoside/choline kinase family phosphotransferase